MNTNPSGWYVAVTPTDNTPLPNGPCRALWVGLTGNVTVSPDPLTNPTGGALGSVTFFNVPVGILPISASVVWNTGTTAGDIVALY